jgi:hypothetical protein
MKIYSSLIWGMLDLWTKSDWWKHLQQLCSPCGSLVLSLNDAVPWYLHASLCCQPVICKYSAWKSLNSVKKKLFHLIDWISHDISPNGIIYMDMLGEFWFETISCLGTISVRTSVDSLLLLMHVCMLTAEPSFGLSLLFLCTARQY